MATSSARALSRSLLDLCRSRRLTIATAESCTGGLVAGALTDIPGSSDVIDRGFVTYSNDAKRAMLGVDAQTLLTFGAVSKETATQMAVGALERAGVDLAVSITGTSSRVSSPHCRPRRRHAGQAGGAGAFRRRRARRTDHPQRMPLRRNRPHRRARALGGRSAAHADGVGARTAGREEAGARDGNPPAPSRGAIAAPACGEAETDAAGIIIGC